MCLYRKVVNDHYRSNQIQKSCLSCLSMFESGSPMGGKDGRQGGHFEIPAYAGMTVGGGNDGRGGGKDGKAGGRELRVVTGYCPAGLA